MSVSSGLLCFSLLVSVVLSSVLVYGGGQKDLVSLSMMRSGRFSTFAVIVSVVRI